MPRVSGREATVTMPMTPTTARNQPGLSVLPVESMSQVRMYGAVPAKSAAVRA